MKFRGERIGVFTEDPGTTTGLSWGTYDIDPKLDSFEIVKRGLLGTAEVNHLGAEDVSAFDIVTRWLAAREIWKSEGLSQDRQFFVYEDFILYPNKHHSSARAGLSPARVHALVQGMLYGDAVYFVPQMAATMKTKTSRNTQTGKRGEHQRLKDHGLWIPASAHKRDAVGHAVLFVASVM
jgi:hypothetical protein